MPTEGLMDWSDDLIEWVYGPVRWDEDEDEDVGEMYRSREEEDRIRWIPGYRETVEQYLAALRAWTQTWHGTRDIPPEPERLKELRARISEWQKQRAIPPWEQPAS